MIHPQSIISSNAIIGNNVSVGAFSIIHDRVEVGDNCSIGSYCELGIRNALCDDSPLALGSGANIRSHTVLYASTSIGKGFTTGHHATIREKLTIGEHVQVGSYGELQGHSIIEDNVRMQSGVIVGKECVVRRCAWLYPGVLLTNDRIPPSEQIIGCEIGEYSVICAQSVILAGVTIGNDCLIAAQSFVRGNVGDGRVVEGNPGRDIGPVSRIIRGDGSRKPAYPWRFHFHRGYPEKLVAQWRDEARNLEL